jgi:hypothetical protein
MSLIVTMDSFHSKTFHNSQVVVKKFQMRDDSNLECNKIAIHKMTFQYCIKMEKKQNLVAVRGVFVMMPRGVPRAITTWTWVLRGGSRTQNLTEGPKFGPKASGASSKSI